MQHMYDILRNNLCCRVDKGLESLFWSLFGLTDLDTFGIDKPEFQIIRQTGVALFGLYQVLIAVVAINMLIAMMTRSFETIVVRIFSYKLFICTVDLLSAFNPLFKACKFFVCLFFGCSNLGL